MMSSKLMELAHAAALDAEREPGELERSLEAFLIEHLTRAGVWTGRDSDGIALTRSVERSSERASIAGRVWLLVPQTQEPFWLTLDRSPNELRWTLHYGLAEGASRRDRDVVIVADSPDAIPWQTSLSGSVRLP